MRNSQNQQKAEGMENPLRNVLKKSFRIGMENDGRLMTPQGIFDAKRIMQSNCAKKMEGEADENSRQKFCLSHFYLCQFL